MAETIVALHGWACDASVWGDWAVWASGRGMTLVADDLGYFGTPQPMPMHGDWLFTHSFGLHRVTPTLAASACGLVVFNGFAHFHPAGEAGDRSRRSVVAMLERCLDDPQGLLKDFQRRCWRPDPVPDCLPTITNVPGLHADLQTLDRAELALAPLRTIPRRLVIHSHQDRIVPLALAEELARQLGADFWLFDGGHCLPFASPEPIRARLESWLA